MVRENEQGAVTESAAQFRKRVLLVLIAMFLGALVLSIGAAWCTGDWGGLALNVGTELGGAAVTYYLFDRVIRRMEELEEEREAKEKEKAELIAQMGSRVQDVAIAATEKLRRHGWLFDGSLQGARLNGANLQGALLSDANLAGASLFVARLQGASLAWANLSGACLEWANLEMANLEGQASTRIRHSQTVQGGHRTLTWSASAIPIILISGALVHSPGLVPLTYLHASFSLSEV